MSDPELYGENAQEGADGKAVKRSSTERLFSDARLTSLQFGSKQVIEGRDLLALETTGSDFVYIRDQALIAAYLENLKGDVRSYSRSYSASQHAERFEKTEEKRLVLGLGGEFLITALIATAAVARVREQAPVSAELRIPCAEIEAMAYGEPHAEQASDSIKDQRVAEIMTLSTGLSGSLTDYMFATGRERPTFIIGTSDSLVSIAEALYGDGLVGYLLADLNRDRTVQYEKDGRRYVETRAREVLKLPLADDLSCFSKVDRDGRPLLSQNLVTVVQESVVDREVVEELLRPVVVAPKKTSFWPAIKGLEFSAGSTTKLNLGQRSYDKLKLRSIIAGGIKLRRSIDL